MLVVVGLGNPGGRYAQTRHNLGFMVVDELLRRCGARAKPGAGDYEAVEVVLEAAPALLVKPTTYVNRSGQAIQQLATQHGFEPGELLVVLDDVYLPFGRLRLRPAGSAGGHNGLQSVLEAMGTPAFPRLRLGVGAPEGSAALPDHVLGGFTTEERVVLADFVGRGADAVARVAQLGVEHAMPFVNSTPAA